MLLGHPHYQANSPHAIYGSRVVTSTRVTLDPNNTPPAVLTELKYGNKECANLPADNTKDPDNDVHICV